MRLPAFLRRLGSDRRGLSVVELGLVAPVLALFIAGIIDLSQGLAERHALHQAINRSFELMVAVPPDGDPDESDVDYGYLITEAATVAGVAEDAVTIDRWLQCGETRMEDYAADCPDEEGNEPARYLSMEITKPFNGNFYTGTIDIVASSAIRIQ
jgi:hypothetical protein